MRRLFPLILGANHLLAACAQDVTCYKPDATSRTFNGTVLCNSVDGAVSMCCGWNDTCLRNGLCKTNTEDTSYWRDMCSISSWPETGCLKVCTDDADVGEFGNAMMTPCDGTDYSDTWCCGGTTDCCGTDAEITVPANIYESSSTPASTPTSTSISTSASLTSTEASRTSGAGAIPPSEQPSASTGLSSGAKAGIGVGVAAGVIIVIGLLAFFVIQRRRKKAGIASGTMFGSSAQPGTVPGVPQELAQTLVYGTAADTQNTRYELPTGPSTMADR